MRALRWAGILMVVFFVAVTVGPVAEQGAYAGGGIDYTVTVKNDTNEECWVTVYVSRVAYNDPYLDDTLGPGESTTFHTGAWCPSGLKCVVLPSVENLWNPKEFLCHILGHPVANSVLFSAWCGSSSWQIVKQGYDYKFQKE